MKAFKGIVFLLRIKYISRRFNVPIVPPDWILATDEDRCNYYNPLFILGIKYNYKNHF